MPSKKEFIYRIQPVRPDMLTEGATQEESDIIDAHFRYLQTLTRAGTVILAGRTLNTGPASFGIVIFKAEDEIAARNIMMNDPAVAKGVMRAELFPFHIALNSWDIH